VPLPSTRSADSDKQEPALCADDRDFRRQAEAAHDAHDLVLRDTLLALLEWGITEGDEALDNAISISFV
jgi:hypothetical protein